MEFSFWGACVIGGVGKSDKVITGGASKALPERCKQKNPPFKKQRIPVCRKSQAEMLGFFIDMWYNKYGDERC